METGGCLSYMNEIVGNNSITAFTWKILPYEKYIRTLCYALEKQN